MGSIPVPPDHVGDRAPLVAYSGLERPAPQESPVDRRIRRVLVLARRRGPEHHGELEGDVARNLHLDFRTGVRLAGVDLGGHVEARQLVEALAQASGGEAADRRAGLLARALSRRGGSIRRGRRAVRRAEEDERDDLVLRSRGLGPQRDLARLEWAGVVGIDLRPVFGRPAGGDARRVRSFGELRGACPERGRDLSDKRGRDFGRAERNVGAACNYSERRGNHGLRSSSRLTGETKEHYESD